MLLIGNWKMNGLATALGEAETIAAAAEAALQQGIQLALCPPATLLRTLSHHVAGTPLLTGGQDCHVEHFGAYTGDISAAMIKDAGAHYVIVGHSERRQNHHETSMLVQRKAQTAIEVGLVPILCIGEHRSQRDVGQAESYVLGQLQASLPELGSNAQIIIAYEPIWAVGTGLVPSLADLSSMYQAIFSFLETRLGNKVNSVRLLYGGSVTQNNISDLVKLNHIDGALVGGASLTAASFLSILNEVCN
ncbi:triose-phosphate isomerase [Candidatus Phycosocius spiralis]|uniref:Triosephosphate isomerase n=1 Tax=Candidatus Phycosocius spiralis TaxID=2815099 RepID=A0ABQ4PT59_9PROT|nr:triose-phosphate isomerase [Candidatus Phycosocius spiralis]GIU66158.1 triosephosphate isomerase [Candidatus Phycosocius spiralis]